MKTTLLYDSEVGVSAEEFCAIARDLNSVIHHPPCTFIKTDKGGQFLGWSLSVASHIHGEVVYLVAKGRALQLFPSLNEVVTFLSNEGVHTFNVSSAI
ncbi:MULTISPECIES: hypothetical protein [unclassified Vibrio]|uniref:hypothetical protein n=1 Tax=unclassified Vibrio TaxID=2614977 RepID=UPI001361A162|nr:MULTISPECIES: hypothetical protein [unclassified Vibrio]NAW58744.1 hypothetical protein [Vibrio sp. V36_P2S2PM302]NAX27177.1 hypothetical protein [Vibrio sp. V38_P2S17PM301]NAX31730.1 hypothetical protein [Vibrio sp. V37_P2S8PM304]